VATWLALDAVDEANGALVVLLADAPGHAAAPPPDDERADAAVRVAAPCGAGCAARHGVALRMRAGDVAVFSSELFHTSPPNGSAVRSRRAHLAQYSQGAVLWDRTMLRAYRSTRGEASPDDDDDDGAWEVGGAATTDEGRPPPLMAAIPCRLGRAGASRLG
jgi:hypothetical protein